MHLILLVHHFLVLSSASELRNRRDGGDSLVVAWTKNRVQFSEQEKKTLKEYLKINNKEFRFGIGREEYRHRHSFKNAACQFYHFFSIKKGVLLFSFVSYVWRFCLGIYTYIYIPHVCLVPANPGFRFPGIKVVNVVRHLELNPGPLHEQEMLFLNPSHLSSPSRTNF